MNQTGVDSSRQGHQGLDLLELGHRWRLETGRRMKRESLLFYTQSPLLVTILKHKLCKISDQAFSFGALRVQQGLLQNYETFYVSAIYT